MRCLCHAVGSPAGLLSVVLPIAKVVAVGLLVSACAGSHTPYGTTSYENPSNVGAWPAAKVAVAPKRELEADGLEVQEPPRARQRFEPDDPSEPFSPNYGPAPIATKAPQHPSRGPSMGVGRWQSIAVMRPVIIRSRQTPMTPDEQQSIIVQAMIAHEQRNP